MITTQITWNDAPLKAAAIAAFRGAAVKSQAVAVSKCSSSRVARSIAVIPAGSNMALIRAGHPLARLIEQGAGAHTIAPRDLRAGGALKFPDGGFVRRPVPHPGMQGRPFLKPAAAAFVALYPSAFRSYWRG